MTRENGVGTYIIYRHNNNNNMTYPSNVSYQSLIWFVTTVVERVVLRTAFGLANIITAKIYYSWPAICFGLLYNFEILTQQRSDLIAILSIVKHQHGENMITISVTNYLIKHVDNNIIVVHFHYSMTPG